MFGGFKFAPSTARQPGHPIFQPRPIARKCIVCGTTKIESQMKPFLLKGEQLNAWTQNYFYLKRPKLFSFYAKLRYTINPYACTEHFTMSGPIPRVRNPMLRSTPMPLSKDRRQTSLLAKMGKRNCSDLLSDGEEPPSIQKIIEKKPSPPPEEPKAPRSEKEVTDAVMAILKAAREEMDKEEEQRKMLRKLARRIKTNPDGSKVMRRKKKKKRRMRRVERDTEREPNEKRIVDGNEPDSDNSEGTIDVEAVDSDAERSTATSSGSGSSSYETDSDSDAEVVAPAPAAPPKLQPMRRMRLQHGFIPLSRRRPQLQQQLLQHRPPPPHMVVVPRRPIPKRPYLIAEPPGQKKASPLLDDSRSGLIDGSRLDGSARPPIQLLHPAAVPKRLTLTTQAGTGANYLRPSWVAPNPDQQSLASVLQKFWNEDSPPSPSSSSSFARPSLQPPRESTARFGQTVIPGTKTKFKPAAISAPTLFAQVASSPTSTTPRLHHPSIRTSALLNNPPLSPSRIIIGSEETVVTTRESDDETKTMVMSSSSSSSSASSSEESDVEVEVCDHSAAERPPVEGQRIEPIEGMEEQLRSRTVSTVLSNSSGETVTSEDEEIDVETVDETSDKGDKMDTVDGSTVGEATPLLLVDEDAADPPGPMERIDRRKQRMPSTAGGMGVGTRMLHHAMAVRSNMMLPPCALVKPPTRLLSSGQYSMKDLLHAQARAAAGQPVRINTKGLVYAPKRPPGARPKDMPRLPVETRGESEWARLERIVEQKMADHRAKLEAEKKRAQLKLVDQQLMSENPPPELEKETDDEGEGKGEIAQLMESMEGRKVLRMTFHDKKDKKKKEDVGVSRIKVLDRSTRPLGVVREEVVATCEDDSDPASSPPAIDQMVARTREWKDKRAKREAFEKKAAKQKQVRNPALIINKDELMGIMLKRKNVVPPPTPIVGIPAPEEYAARREMFDKRRLEVNFLAGLRFGKQLSAREQLKAWQRQKMMVGLIRRGMRDVNLHEEEEEEEEASLVAESLAIVKRVKEEKQKAWILDEIEERKRKMRRGMEKEKEEEDEGMIVEEEGEKDVEEGQKEKEDEEMILELSDIEHDEAGEGRGGKKDQEEMEVGRADRQRARAVSADGEWKMKGAARVKKEDNEEEGETRRKSHRLRVKREALPKSERRLIWKGSDDEEEEEGEVTPTPADTPSSHKAEQQQPAAVVDAAGKRKRGRPRKNPPAPAPKRKRVSKVMTAKEKEVLSRVLAPVEKSDDLTMEELAKDGEEREMGGGSGMEMLLSLIDDNGATEDGVREKEDGMEEEGMKERQRAEAARRERELEDMREMEQLEVQTPKAADDAPVPPAGAGAAKCRRMPWSWSQRLTEDMAVNAEMGGRLCNYCMKHQKRYIWIPNEALALMDHARTHCVETLMCPSKYCTYMNTHRSRIAQHVSYVHKKWGMPIDLSEAYPSMRKSLMMRLRQCFPDLPNVAVCLLCRVAVRIDADEFRWHAQSHLETSVFECSRNICTLKFATEQECIDHIQQANCRGSVVSGMTDEMEDEVTVLVERCFPGGKVLEQQDEQAAAEGEQPDAVPVEEEEEEDGDDTTAAAAGEVPVEKEEGVRAPHDDAPGDLMMMMMEEEEAHSSTPSVSPSNQEMESGRRTEEEEERETAVRDDVPMDEEETGEMEQP